MEDLQKDSSFINIGKYKAIPPNKGGLIGRGSFGKVLKGIDPDTKQVIALKLIPKSKISKSSYSEKLFQREVDIQKAIRGKNIVNFIDLLEYGENLVIVTEFCNDGDLAKKIENQSFGLSENLLLKYLRDFLEGYKVLLDNKIIHRDIKPGNLLIHDGVLKIADFGLSKHIDADPSLSHTLGIGSPMYMAPEVLLKKPYDNLCDVWSLGITLHEARFGYTPWADVQDLQELQDAVKFLANKPYKFPSDTESKLKPLLEAMIQFDPKKRITWQELFNHPLLQSGQVKKTEPERKDLSEESKTNATTIDLKTRGNAKENPQVNNKSPGIEGLQASNQKPKATMPLIKDEQLTDDDLREIVKIEEIKKIQKDNLRIIHYYIKIAKYILYSIERCQRIFKENKPSNPKEHTFFEESRLIELRAIFLKIGIIILDNLNELQNRNSIELEMWESFIESSEYKKEKSIVSGICSTFKVFFEDFCEKISSEMKSQFNSCLFSEELTETAEFKAYVAKFEKEFVGLTYSAFKNMGKKVSRDFLIVVEMTMNIVNWKQVFQQKKGKYLDIEKLIENLEFEGEITLYTLVRNKVENRFKILYSSNK
mgnify:CR=1 FL=1